MRTHTQQASRSHSMDRMMLGTLKRQGAQTMEGLSSLTGIGWAQVFLSVDRLSRIGKVSLTPVRPCEYRISIAGLLREHERGLDFASMTSRPEWRVADAFENFRRDRPPVGRGDVHWRRSSNVSVFEFM